MTSDERYVLDEFEVEEEEAKMKLLVVDLRDWSIQKLDIPRLMFCYPEDKCTFLKYKENQMVKIRSDCENLISNMVRITIESFERMKPLD